MECVWFIVLNVNHDSKWFYESFNCCLKISDEHGDPDLDDIDEEEEDEPLDDEQMDVEQAPPSVPIPAPAEPPVKRKRGRPPKNAAKASPTKSIAKTTTGNVCSSAYEDKPFKIF